MLQAISKSLAENAVLSLIVLAITIFPALMWSFKSLKQFFKFVLQKSKYTDDSIKISVENTSFFICKILARFSVIFLIFGYSLIYKSLVLKKFDSRSSLDDYIVYGLFCAPLIFMFAAAGAGIWYIINFVGSVHNSILTEWYAEDETSKDGEKEVK